MTEITDRRRRELRANFDSAQAAWSAALDERSRAFREHGTDSPEYDQADARVIEVGQTYDDAMKAYFAAE